MVGPAVGPCRKYKEGRLGGQAETLRPGCMAWAQILPREAIIPRMPIPVASAPVMSRSRRGARESTHPSAKDPARSRRYRPTC
jgi:hypothetical protein